MTAPAPLPSDAIPTEAAAKLLGLGPERIRQLMKSGFIPKIARGHTTVGGAISGYIAFLKAQARKSPASTAASRSHNAKADLICASTARRKAELIPLDEAESVVNRIARTACARLRRVPVGAKLTGSTKTTLATEIGAAIEAIEQARDRALAALNTGDFSEISGGRDE